MLLLVRWVKWRLSTSQVESTLEKAPPTTAREEPARKEPADEPTAGANEAGVRAKLQLTMDNVAEDLVCPINRELPVNPVFAEDGFVYERAAIEKWLRTKERSPMTRKPIGGKLVPAVSVKRAIVTLVESGFITGGKADEWQGRLRRSLKTDGHRAQSRPPPRR